MRACAPESNIQKHGFIGRMDVIEIPKIVSWKEVSPIFYNIIIIVFGKLVNVYHQRM